MLIERLGAIVGSRGLLLGEDTAGYTEDWRKLYQGRTPAVVRPAGTEEVAAVVRACAETGTPLVPQGGNTSMVGGATPRANGQDVVLSLSRMNRVRDVDVEDMTMVVEAGVVWKTAQDAAAAAGCWCGPI